jgi:hypothetical protein
MSVSSERGKQLELDIAKLITKKTGTLAKRDSRSGANWHRPADIFTSLPVHIEAKDHETIKIKEWYRQADAAASFNQIPTVVFRMDSDIMATMRFTDMLDLLVEIADLKAEVVDLRRPVKETIKVIRHTIPDEELQEMVENKKIERDYRECRDGHLLAPGSSKCSQKGCRFSAGYKPKKEKKK